SPRARAQVASCGCGSARGGSRRRQPSLESAIIGLSVRSWARRVFGRVAAAAAGRWFEHRDRQRAIGSTSPVCATCNRRTFEPVPWREPAPPVLRRFGQWPAPRPRRGSIAASKDLRAPGTTCGERRRAGCARGRTWRGDATGASVADDAGSPPAALAPPLPQLLLQQVAHRPELLFGDVAFRDQVRHELERRILVDAAEDAVQTTLARGLVRDRREIDVLAPFIAVRDRALLLVHPEMSLVGVVG